MGLLRVRHSWLTSLSLFTFMHWRRQWQPTPVFLSGESQGPESLVGCRLWGCTESDTTEWLSSSSMMYIWRRKWQPTSVFLFGEFHGQKSLACYSPWGHKESDTTKQLTLSLSPVLCTLPSKPHRCQKRGSTTLWLWETIICWDSREVRKDCTVLLSFFHPFLLLKKKFLLVYKCLRLQGDQTSQS